MIGRRRLSVRFSITLEKMSKRLIGLGLSIIIMNYESLSMDL